MNILFQIRDDYKKNIAGDSIQMLMTKKYLEKLGVNVEVSAGFDVNLDGFDIIHIFNIIRIKEPYRYFLNVLKQKKPYVISTIYWNMKNYIKQSSGISSSNVDWWNNSNPMRKEILVNASAFLPNSNIEMDMIKEDFHINKDFYIIPNCSDELFYKAESKKFVAKYHKKDFVLCVGRISNRKNQLALIKALRKTDYQLILIGGALNDEYFKACKKAANENTFFIDEMKHHNLASAYAAAKVHVLPSWFETPGLSSLEAGLAGCNVVTTNKGCPREYFRDYAAYCDPSSEKSIKEQVDRMYHTPKNQALSRHIYNNYLWENAARKTLEAYKQVMQKIKLG